MGRVSSLSVTLRPAPIWAAQFLSLLCALIVSLNTSKLPINCMLSSNVANTSQWPYFVWLREITTNRKCGGVLMDERSVLTLHSCVQGKEPKDIGVSYGSKSEEGERKRKNIASHICYLSSFKSFTEPNGTVNRYEDDFALLRLEEPLAFEGSDPRKNNFIRAVKFDTNAESMVPKWLDENSKCYALGGGYSPNVDKIDDLKLARHLRYNQVKFRVCHEKFANNTICYHATKNQAAGLTCEGDEGGPIVCEKDGDFLLVALMAEAKSRLDCEPLEAASLNVAVWFNRFLSFGYHDCKAWFASIHDK